MLKFSSERRRAKTLTSPDNGRRSRQLLKDAMPRVALSDCHVEGAALLPTRRHLLAKLPADGVACELGVSKGQFTAEILEVNKPATLHLVDAWSSARYAGDLELVRRAFAEGIASGRVHIHQGLSTEVLPDFPDEYFDWIYIDTDHSYRTTSAELDICKQKVKPGGRIAGHDFCTGNVVAPVAYGVVEACNEFCIREGWRYEFLTLDPNGHFSFCLSRITG